MKICTAYEVFRMENNSTFLLKSPRQKLQTLKSAPSCQIRTASSTYSYSSGRNPVGFIIWRTLFTCWRSVYLLQEKTAWHLLKSTTSFMAYEYTQGYALCKVLLLHIRMIQINSSWQLLTWSLTCLCESESALCNSLFNEPWYRSVYIAETICC